MTQLQPLAELERFYDAPDPWNYKDSADDARRRSELLGLLPSGPFERTLDIGCGDGFMTFELPGRDVVGVDVSERALHWAEQARAHRPDAARFAFRRASIFELDARELGNFDLIVITGVLYPQYIGRAFSVVATLVDELLRPGGYVASCHIDEWKPPRFPYSLIDAAFYPYRGRTHRLEICVK